MYPALLCGLFITVLHVSIHATCQFVMQSGDVTATSAIVQASLLSLKCRKPPYTQHTIGVRIEASHDIQFSHLFLNATQFVSVSRGGDDPRQHAGAYVAKVYLTGLTPDTPYYYRFITTSGVVSPIGRTKTLYSDTFDGSFSFLHISCANENPYPVSNALHDHVRARRPDFTLFNGDVVYADRFWVPSNVTANTGVVRCCNQPRQTVEYYRGLYLDQRDKTYTGPGFPDVLRTVPTYSTWDDHAVNDNYAGRDGDPRMVTELLSSPGAVVPDVVASAEVRNMLRFGYQAFFEMNGVTPAHTLQRHDPVQGLKTPYTRLFRRFKVGRAIEVFVLDLRQYRDAPAQSTSRIPVLPTGVSAAQLCDAAQNGRIAALCGTLLQGQIGGDDKFRSGQRTLLGAAQKTWLKKSLAESTAKFKIIVSSVQISEWYGVPNDRWEGYWQERTELLGFIEQKNIANVVFLVGDVHASVFSRVNPGRTPAIHEFTTGPIGRSTLGAFVGPLAPAFVDFIYKYGGNGHTMPRSERPVKFATIDTPNFMGVSYANSKLLIECFGPDGKIVVDTYGNTGRFELASVA